MTKRIAINGFGRIGRLVFKFLSKDSDYEIVAINDLADTKTLAHLLKYDTTYGKYEGEISHSDNSITVNGKEIKILAERSPKDLPWGELDIDLVIECTGFFTKKEDAEQHITAGAKKVVISAPGKGDIKTIVYNVNHEILTADDLVISGASCTTNCLAPIAKVLHDNFTIVGGVMNTIHAYTGDQRLLDAAHRDLRRARNAASNIVPTTTGAAAAIGKVIPELNGKLDGLALRIPLPAGSVVDLSFTLEKEPTVEELNAAVKAQVSDTLGYSDEPIVSSDIINMTHGTMFDSLLTQKLEGQKMYKIITWYDNETSYANQLVRTIKYFLSL